MFCLNIALGNVSWRLLFKEEARATLAYELLDRGISPKILLDDDFGQHFGGKLESIHGFMLEDLDKTKLANVEMALHQERTKVMATKLAQSDPGLRADMGRPSPAIISPMGNGSRPF